MTCFLQTMFTECLDPLPHACGGGRGSTTTTTTTMIPHPPQPSASLNPEVNVHSNENHADATQTATPTGTPTTTNNDDNSNNNNHNNKEGGEEVEEFGNKKKKKTKGASHPHKKNKTTKALALSEEDEVDEDDEDDEKDFLLERTHDKEAIMQILTEDLWSADKSQLPQALATLSTYCIECVEDGSSTTSTSTSLSSKSTQAQQQAAAAAAAAAKAAVVTSTASSPRSAYNRRVILDNDGVGLITQVMKMNQVNTEVLAWGAAALANLIDGFGPAADKVHRLGGANTIMIGMKLHPENGLIQSTGCCFIGNFIWNDRARMKLAVELGAIDSILVAMAKCPTDRHLQKCSTWVLYSLCQRPEYVSMVAQAGGLCLIARTVELHRDDHDIKIQAKFIINTLQDYFMKN